MCFGKMIFNMDLVDSLSTYTHVYCKDPFQDVFLIEEICIFLLKNTKNLLDSHNTQGILYKNGIFENTPSSVPFRFVG